MAAIFLCLCIFMAISFSLYADIGDVLINEFSADNDAIYEDPDDPGEFSDWIELYNPGPGAVDLSGAYLTDELGDTTQYQIPSGVTLPCKTSPMP